MALKFGRAFNEAFPTPRILAMPTIGLDISTSGLKFIELEQTHTGPVMKSCGSIALPEGVIQEGDIANKEVFVATLKKLLKKHKGYFAQVGLPEQKSYLFSHESKSVEKGKIIKEVAEKIDGYVPLPGREAIFDVDIISTDREGSFVAGVAYARRIISLYSDACKEAGLIVRGLEPESVAIGRAVLPKDFKSTAMLVDMGKTTTKISVISNLMPVYTVTLDIGGHALTKAVQKHYGVTEDEAIKIKLQTGITREDDDLLVAMLSTLSAIREEVAHHFFYWQKRAENDPKEEKISKVLLMGGNANTRGLAEYMSAGLGTDVDTGDPMTNLSAPDDHLPPLPRNRALSYSTAIGLALRSFYI